MVFALVSTGFMLCQMSPESDAGPANTVEVSYSHGRLIDKATGLEYGGGEFTKELTLKFIPNRGYEFTAWDVSGKADYASGGSEISLRSVEGPVSISVGVRNYSTSQELINVVDVGGLPEPGDDLVLAWSFKSGALDMTGGMWHGMPCTPLIVGDYAYVRAGGRLYQLEVDSGTVVHQVLSQGASEDYYHYLSYGNGVLFDTTGHRAYDLDLNHLYDLPANLTFATYHDGFFYGCQTAGSGRYTMYKTSLEDDRDLDNNVKMNLFSSTVPYRVWAQYGQFSNVLFVGDWFFFLEADRVVGPHGYRAITAFNLRTEESVTCRLTGFEGMPWDDGWLTYYDGYFYLTAYVAGLFDGVIQGLEDKRSSLMWVRFDFDGGRFEEPSFKNIQTPSGREFLGIASGLVIHNGRGYLNVRALGTDTLGGSDDRGSCMIAYDIGEGGEPIPKCATPSMMTHGGIVVNVAHAGEGKIHVYLIPYNKSGQALFVFTDSLTNGEWTLKPSCDRLEMARTDWCSQCIRAGPNGETLFYVDSGYIDCYVPADRYRVNVITVDGKFAKSETGCGKNVQDVLKKLHPTIEIRGRDASIGDKDYRIYGLNEVTNAWALVTNPSKGTYSGVYKNGITESTFRQVLLLEKSSSMDLPEDGEKGWYYFDGEYKKASFRDKGSLRDSAGRSWFYMDAKPSDDFVRFEPLRQVNRDSVITIELPEHLSSTFAVSDDSVISVSRHGNTLSVTGLKEKTADITVEIEGRQYVISVTVLPKVTIEDGKTVTLSEKEDTTDDGGTVHTVKRTVESETGVDMTFTETVKDSLGNVVSERNVSESRRRGLTMDGQEADIVERSERFEEKGAVKSDTRYFSETVTARQDDGVVRVTSTESTEDRLAGTIDITRTERTEYASYDTSIVTVEHYVGSSDVPVSSATRMAYDSKLADFGIVCENGTAVVDMDENSTVDISGLMGALSKDPSVDRIRVNAGAIISAKAIGAAAGAGAVMVMDTGSATITLNADSLKKLASAEGNVRFSVEPGAKMTPKQQSAAGDAKVFSVELTCGEAQQHDFGRFVLSVSCGIEVQEGKTLKVWRIGDYGKKTYADGVTFKDGVVSFAADHLSIYAIGYESESSDPSPDPSPGPSSDGGSGNGGDATIYMEIGAAAALVLLGAVIIIRRRA